MLTWSVLQASVLSARMHSFNLSNSPVKAKLQTFTFDTVLSIVTNNSRYKQCTQQLAKWSCFRLFEPCSRDSGNYELYFRSSFIFPLQSKILSAASPDVEAKFVCGSIINSIIITFLSLVKYNLCNTVFIVLKPRYQRPSLHIQHTHVLFWQVWLVTRGSNSFVKMAALDAKSK